MDIVSKRGFEALTYRFQDQVPEPGEATEVADGVLWIRMPMGGRLNHINVWLLRDNEGWTIVDTGIFSDSVKAHWETIFERYLDGKPVTRVIATHLHTDHTGVAGWIVTGNASASSVPALRPCRQAIDASATVSIWISADANGVL